MSTGPTKTTIFPDGGGGGGGGGTLQDAYNNSAAPATIVATAAKAITLSNAVDATNVLNVNRTFAGLGAGINVSMGATTTGIGVNVSQVIGATGAGIQVLHTTGVGVAITQNSANSGNSLTVTQSSLGLGTGIVASHLGGLRAADLRNNNGTVGAVLIAAEGTGTSTALEVTADGSHTGVTIISQNSDAMIVDSMAGGNLVDFRRSTVSVLRINGPGSIIATPTSGQNFTVDTLGAGAISLDSAAASNFTVSGAAADLTLGARAATIALNQAAPNNTLVAGFTATSIIGALNELRNSPTRTVTGVNDTLTAADAVVLLDSAGASRTLTLPAHVEGLRLFIVDAVGTFDSFPVTVARAAGGNIQGLAASYVYSVPWGALQLVSVSGNWHILGG